MSTESELASAIAEATGRVIWLVTSDGLMAEESPSWRALTGQAPGDDWRDAIHPEDRATVERARRPGRWEVEHRVGRPGDRYTRMHTVAVPLLRGGHVMTTTEVWTDEAVRRADARFRVAMHAANVAAWEYDFLAGQMTRTENHDALYGLPHQDVWQYDVFTAATHPDDRPLADRTIQACVAPGGPDRYQFEFRVIWPDGSTHWLNVTGEVHVRDAEGRGVLVRGALFDVTPLKTVEQDLRDAVRVRDEFLQIASHELKTPLTPLSLKLQNLERMASSDRLNGEHVLRDVRLAQRQVARLVELVGDLLDVTRLTRGQLALTREPVSLAELAHAVVERVQPEAARAGCELRLRIDDDPAGSWDRTRLEQVLDNLLQNAIKYGRGKPIDVELGGDEACARLVVRDQGIGIEPDVLPRIFDKFERGSTSLRHYGGLGLGLYIVRQIVEAHGGTIVAASAPGAGATFTVELPRG